MRDRDYEFLASFSVCLQVCLQVLFYSARVVLENCLNLGRVNTFLFLDLCFVNWRVEELGRRMTDCVWIGMIFFGYYLDKIK